MPRDCQPLFFFRKLAKNRNYYYIRFHFDHKVQSQAINFLDVIHERLIKKNIIKNNVLQQAHLLQTGDTQIGHNNVFFIY